MGVPVVTFKRGDTFKLNCQVTDSAVTTLAGWTVRSHIRKGTTLIDALKYTLVNATAKQFTLQESSAGVTKNWATGIYTCDIEYTTPGGDVFSTENFHIDVVPDQTYT